jgi:hypothetical protein
MLDNRDCIIAAELAKIEEYGRKGLMRDSFTVDIDTAVTGVLTASCRMIWSPSRGETTSTEDIRKFFRHIRHKEQQNDTSQIRLPKFMTGSDGSSVTYPPDKSDGLSTPYTALSYIWGSDKNTQNIFVDDLPFAVHQISITFWGRYGPTSKATSV